MGLFDFVKKTKKESSKSTAARRVAEIDTEPDRRIDVQDAAITEVRFALDAFAEDGDAQKLAEVLEQHVVENESGTNWSFSYIDKLVKLYLEEGKNDKAWWILNKVSTARPKDSEKISKLRVGILKKENRYPDAMFHLVHQHFYSLDRLAEYDPGKFVKEAKPVAKKMSMSDEDVERLSALIVARRDSGSRDEAALAGEIKEILCAYTE